MDKWYFKVLVLQKMSLIFHSFHDLFATNKLFIYAEMFDSILLHYHVADGV